jgi:hypothetical protein
MVLKSIKGWVLPAVLSVFMVLAWAAQMDTSQRLLGKIWPVVGVLNVESVAPEIFDNLSGVRISGSAEKRRDCVWLGVSWYLGGPNRVPIAAKFSDRPQNNAPGRLHWTGLLVGIEPGRLRETYGEVTHQCGALKVRSRFYAGGKP